MPISTLLLDFRLNDAVSGLQEIESIFLGGIQTQPNFGQNSVTRIFSDGKSILVFSGPRESLITVRHYPSTNFVTVTLEYQLNPGQDPILTLEESKALELAWSNHCKVAKTVATLPSVSRDIPFDIYFPTTDGRLLEYDVQEVLFDQRSEFQHIQIFRTNTFGRMLVLDDDLNLAESDSIYTELLMKRGIEKYGNSEVLILGGGDGALLYEILKENPKNVVMLELDEMVMNACKEHLRSPCGTVLDQLSGENYEILTGDCLPRMMEMLNQNVKLDFIFADLTTVPITSAGTEDEAKIYEFVAEVLRISFQLLRRPGKYFTHGPGTSGREAAAKLEAVIDSQTQLSDAIVEISKQSAFIPSFGENWAFYAIQLSPKN